MMDQQMEANSLSSRIETRITAHGSQNKGDAEDESMSPRDCNEIVKTSHIRTTSSRNSEGEIY